MIQTNIGEIDKSIEKVLVDGTLIYKTYEDGRKEREAEIIEMGNKLDKSYVIDKKKMFWRELKDQIKEAEQ